MSKLECASAVRNSVTPTIPTSCHKATAHTVEASFRRFLSHFSRVPYSYIFTSEKLSPHSLRKRPPLWSSGQSSWLQIQRLWFYSQRHQISWEIVGLERGPLSLVNTTEKLLGRKSSDSGLETEITAVGDDYVTTLYPQKLALTSHTRGGHSVGTALSRTQATEFFLYVDGDITLMHFLLFRSIVTLPFGKY
jgi:hypothetical protein